MTNWQQHRQRLIALTFVGILLTLGRFSLDATAGKRSVKPFAFPSVVPLPKRQLLESRSLAEPTATHPDSMWDSVLAGQKYYYHQNNQQVEIEMRYVVATAGELNTYFKYLSSIQLPEEQLLQNVRQHKGVGFYSLFVHQGRSHLSACINPHGGSTVTSAQFLANRHTYDLQPQRLFPWLLGKESLLDKRCVWAHLSTPLSQMPAETSYSVLEQAWLSWYQWWNSRFPEY